jgi:hypothetical protein
MLHGDKANVGAKLRDRKLLRRFADRVESDSGVAKRHLKALTAVMRDYHVLIIAFNRYFWKKKGLSGHGPAGLDNLPLLV